MEALIAAAGIVLVAIASILGAIFQAKKRGAAEGEAEHHEYKAEQLESVLDDTRLAQQARDAVRDNLRSGGSLRDDPNNRDEN